MTGRSARPRFSIVTAVYDVEPYLPAFIDSIERQRVEPDELEVVAVDDGSTDGSLDLLGDWARRSRFTIKVFTKPNGGQGSARNLGLDHASGEWVTFPDPDDMLEPDYLRVAARFATDHPAVEAMSARPVLLYESTGRTSAAHPRRWQYRGGNRAANLLSEPNVFFGVASGSFFRLDRIVASQLRFDTRIRPNFEDGHFAARYVLGLSRPEIGLLRDAVYVYRKRAAGTSSLQGSMRHPGRYSVVPELGYLDLLDRGRQPDGSTPSWIQQLVVYELSWYLSEDERGSAAIDIAPDVIDRFHELLDRILRELDPAVVAGHGARILRPAWSDMLAHSGRGETWHSPELVRSDRDGTAGLRRYHYRFVGPPPAESVATRGGPVEARFARTTAIRLMGRDRLWERTLSLPDPAGLEITLDGEVMPIRWGWHRVQPAGRDASWRLYDAGIGHDSDVARSGGGRLARLAVRLAAGGASDARRLAATALLSIGRAVAAVHRRLRRRFRPGEIDMPA